MLIIHELGHILTRWRTGEKCSPKEFRNVYARNAEAGYFLQNKLFDGILRLAANDHDLTEWNSETRFEG